MFSKPIPKPSEPTLPRSSPYNERVRSKRESAECRAFRNCFSVLVDGITDPRRLAVQLYSKELIGPHIRREAQKLAIAERVKIEMLLSAVEDQIVASPATKFREFVDVLQNEPSLQHLATRLESTHCELVGVSHHVGVQATRLETTHCELVGVSHHVGVQATRLESTHCELVGVSHHVGVQATNESGVQATDVPDVSVLSSELETVVDWHKLGLNLGLPKHELDKIRQDYQWNNRQRLEMLDKWLRRTPNATWGDVVRAVQQMGENRVAENICVKYIRGGGSVFEQPRQTPMLQYASYLKSVYTREKLPVYDKWPHVKSKKYINLALVKKEDITKREADQFTRATIHGHIDDIKKSKQVMGIGQIAQEPDRSQPKCILMEGAPGVGKSTLAWKLCRKWGKGKLLQQFELVVLLRLRDKSVRAAKKISDLFRYHDHQTQQAAVEEIQRTGGKWVLLLFEGYDELPKELRSESSIFLDVITGTELPEATVLITSRPWASEVFHRECKRHISQHIEILGFTKANIQSYLESTIPGDPLLLADLKKYISCYPHVNSLMYLPLNSAIVVEVYRNSRKDKTLVPKTMTELYSSLVRSLLLRHLLGHPVHGKNRRWRVCSFNDLPQDVYQQLCELTRIAYEGILHGQQVIFSDLPEDFEALGLMQCVPELYADEGAAVSYNFLHLTVQEYLAAFHLSQQPVEKQIEHFREYKEHTKKRKQHHFHMVLRFLCGIKKFSAYSSEMLNTLCVKTSVGLASVIHEVTFDTLHWLFETQDNDLIANILGSSNIKFKEKFREEASFDYFVLGYCVSHSNCTWKIVLEFCHIADEEMEMLVQGALEEETHCTRARSSDIDLSKNDITMSSEGVKHVLSLPEQLINNVEELYLHRNNLDPESCTTLALFILHVPHLKYFYLSNDPNIGQGGAVTLITSLTYHNSLEWLRLKKIKIGVEDCQALSELLSLSTSLKELDISHNDLPPEAVELIISGLHHNTTLERLDMSYSHFSLQNTISLASVLSTNRTLVHLNLRRCNTGECQLASVLCINNTLQELELGANPIGVKGATAFAEMLLKNKSLKKLDLRDNSIGEEGTQKLIDSLKHNKTVHLWLPEKYESHAQEDTRVTFSLPPLSGTARSFSGEWRC